MMKIDKGFGYKSRMAKTIGSNLPPGASSEIERYNELWRTATIGRNAVPEGHVIDVTANGMPITRIYHKPRGIESAFGACSKECRGRRKTLYVATPGRIVLSDKCLDNSCGPLIAYVIDNKDAIIITQTSNTPIQLAFIKQSRTDKHTKTYDMTSRTVLYRGH